MAGRKNDKNWRNRIFFLIRFLLLLSIFINFFLIIAGTTRDSSVSEPELIKETGKRMEFIFWGALTLFLTFLTDYIEKKEKMDIPDILESFIVVFIYAAIFLSARFNLYYRYFWWDDLLHAFSGFIIGFIGFIVIYKINHNFSMNLNPLLVALFSFTFAVTLGVFWEILEFLSDIFLGTANQKWNLPDTETLIGRSYQGSGLRDTMSDLIIDSLGALITSVITYFIYKFQKNRTLERMGKMLSPAASEENAAEQKDHF